MEQFNIEVADNEGTGHTLTVKPISREQYQIFEQQERVATIEIDEQDTTHCRQSLDCRIDLSLINAVRDSILLQGGLHLK